MVNNSNLTEVKIDNKQVLNTELKVFNCDLGSIRVIIDDNNDILFCLKDVCNCIGLKDDNAKVRALNEEFGDGVLLTHPIIDTLGREQKAIFITEPQLYFVMMSSTRCQKAKPFRQWVVNEVLPSIRKTGSYSINKEQPTHNNELSKEFKINILKDLSDKYRDKCEGRYSQILDSYITKEAFGEHLLPLPESTEKYYSATEIGKILGVSANMVGRLAKKYNLKTEEYGKWFIDKAKHSNKEVQSFYYNKSGLEKLEAMVIYEQSRKHRHLFS